jgi:hypothetical protein
MAATVFWFFNALNKNYSANITFPLDFEYNEDAYVPVKPLPTSLRLNVSGLGWDLFRKSSGLKVPKLVIPLEHPTETQKIVGSMLPAHLATQLEDIQINFVLTDTLRIELDERVRKRFKITIDSIRRYLHPDYGLFGELKLSKDSVWLEGPKKVVNKLPDVLTLALPRRNISKDFTEEIEIVFENNESVKRNPPLIEVSFELEKLIQVNDHVELDVVHASPKARAAFNGKEINFTYRLPGSVIKKFSADSIRATIDLRGFKKGTYKLVPLIEGLPNQAFLVKVDTISVDI